MSTTYTGYDDVILAGDVGGTNINLALIGRKAGNFSPIFERHYKSQEERNFNEPLARFLEQARRESGGPEPNLCCVSAAGPVADGRCELTNVSWRIDESQVRGVCGLPCRLINDFTAISYGVVLLDPRKEDELLSLTRADGTVASLRDGTSLVIGAGTGLGVGYLNRFGDKRLAFPSEGGHMILPVFDDESYAYSAWYRGRFGEDPGAEAAVSGQGIGLLFEFLAQSGLVAMSPASRAIEKMEPRARPAEISRLASLGQAERDGACYHVMVRFVEYYARICASLCLVFMPSSGLYLAGGIAAKNESLFIEDGRFMRSFERSYREHARAILRSTRVMIVRDYAISLYGAANAAVSMR